MNLRTSQSNQKGFSLVEVMVAATVGTAVILMMTFAMRVGADGFQQATQRIDAVVEARAALSVMADDVSTMVGGGTQEFGWDNTDERFHEVFFLTLKPVSAQDASSAVGDVCYVHYFTAITQDAPVADAAFSRKLYRRFLSSGDILSRLTGGGLPTPNADPNSAEVVAFNVTRFIAQPKARLSDFGPLEDWTPGNGVPEALEVDFQVVDGDTAALMNQEADWNFTTNRSQNLVLEVNENDESNRGRNFQLNLEIGHAN